MEPVEFPKGPTPPPQPYPYFPDRLHLFIWRNWEFFPASKLAKIVGTTAANITRAAVGMGLAPRGKISPLWKNRGCNTVLRANWQILPYEQLLDLLEWTPEQLVYALKEDDFLFAKLGALKPDCGKLLWHEPAASETRRTAQIRKRMKTHFPSGIHSGEPAFSFLDSGNPCPRRIFPRNTSRSGEISLDGSWRIEPDSSLGKNERIDSFTENFRRKLKEKWGVSLSEKGKKTIRVSIREDSSLPPESHHIGISSGKIEIVGCDANSILRAFQFLLRQMETRNGPYLPEGSFTRNTRIESRIIYPCHAPYANPFTEEPETICPDSLLEQLSMDGINGIWFQGILYTLVPWRLEPALSKGWQDRIANLRSIVRRAANYGIGVYLYMGEPRCLPLTFFRKHPELKGIRPPYVFGEVAALCVSTPEVKMFLRDGMTELFRQVPGLEGIFTITASENPSNCYSKYTGSECPRCSKRSPEEVIAEVNSLIEEGVHRAKPSARVMIWSWGWRSDWEIVVPAPVDWAPGIIERLPEKAQLLCTSEESMPLCIGGVPSYMKDYSISVPGPSGRTFFLWARARKRGLETAAKIQINNSWENASVPYIPVLNLVDEHLRNLENAKVKTLLLSWTVGGFPGTPNLRRLQDHVWHDSGPRPLREFAAELYGEEAADCISSAWKMMSDAFRKFPHSIPVLYFSPLHMGPANILFEGHSDYRATMISFPYNDFARWSFPYPENVFLNQFRCFSEEWKNALDFLSANAPPPERRTDSFNDFLNVAEAAGCHFRTTYLQSWYIVLRDSLSIRSRTMGILRADEERPGILRKIIAILEEEREIAKRLHSLAVKDSRLGFEPTQHYYYRPGDLAEKVINCEYLLEHFRRMLSE